MIDPDAFAALICDWCLELQPSQQVLINTTTLAEAAALAMHRAVLERGAWPLLRLEPPDLLASFFRHAGEQQIDSYAPLELLEQEAVDADVAIIAPANTRGLAGVDPHLLARLMRAHTPIREARLAHRLCVTLWPTPALAQQAGMDERSYTRFVERALFLDRAEPIAAWSELSARQAGLIERLAPRREIRIEADRTDLRLDVTGRTWINSDGRRNMPSGEVFTGPHEGSANGTIRFGVPSVGDGIEVSGVELTFVDGLVTTARADHGDGHLQALLATDEGARRLGELGIGTNPGIDRPTGSTLLDEKIAGTIHLALGSSYPETGGKNVSALHWDLVCDLREGGRVTVDGDPFIEDGALVG